MLQCPNAPTTTYLLGELVPQRVVGAHEQVRRDLALLGPGGHGTSHERLGDARLFLLPLAQQVLGLAVGVAHLVGALVQWCIGASVDALVHWANGAFGALGHWCMGPWRGGRRRRTSLMQSRSAACSSWNSSSWAAAAGGLEKGSTCIG